MAKNTAPQTMQDLLDQADGEMKILEVGDVVEGEIVAVTKGGVWLDLGPYGTGLVVGMEILDPKLKKSIQVGEKMSASVIEPEFDNGEVLLSLKKATREKAWDKLKRVMLEGEPIMVKPYEANKGGLMVEVDGVRGFLPVSQLTPEHYPRVTDKDEILLKLNQFINKAMVVGVLDIDKKENKVIFSEKIAKKSEIEEKMKKFNVGDVAKGRVTGLADFGVFLNIDGIEGLVHISEIAWDKVNNPSDYVKIGDEIDVQIIGIEQDRLSLSIKKLKDDPWAKMIAKINSGDKVKGTVTRITPFGAFVKIDQNIEALVHISELSEDHVADPGSVVEVDKTYEFRIISIDAENHRLALSLKDEKTEKQKSTKTKGPKEEPEAAKKVKEEEKEPKEVKETKEVKEPKRAKKKEDEKTKEKMSK